MAGFHVSRHVEAPPNKVFAVASDFAHAADHIGGITRIEMLTSGPVGKGTRFRETRKVFKREATEEMEVTAFDPPRAYTLACESHGCRYVTELTFEPRGSGTEVGMHFEARPQTLVAKVLGVLFRPMIKMCLKETAKDLDDLKAAAEGRSGAAVGG